MPISRSIIKREVDFQIISEWIEPGSRVLDLGCGRGILLEHLKRTKGVQGVGVDVDFQKILSCIKRGVTVYQGDIEMILKEFPDDFFDWVICSRTLQELEHSVLIIKEALRLSRHMAISFVNQGFWGNRLSILRGGSQVVSKLYPETWDQRRLSKPISIAEFERFCVEQNLQIHRKVYLLGDWKKTCSVLPNLRAGYAIYSIA